eukprot:3082470-Rhodomonas_salina.1
MLGQYRASRRTHVGRYHHTLGQYQASRKTRVGWYHHRIGQYRVSRRTRVGWWYLWTLSLIHISEPTRPRLI